MPLHIVSQKHLKQSDDSLLLASISSCRDQPPSTDEHALPLKQISSLNNDNYNHSLTVGGTCLTKSPSLHSSSSSVYSSSAEPANNPKREYMTTTTSSDTSASSSIVLQSMESTKSIDSSVGVTSVSEGSRYSQISAQRQKREFKQAWSFSSLRKRENGEKNPFKWLCRRSDASIRPSTSELKLEQHGKLEEQSHEPERQTPPPQTIPFNLGPVIVQRMERLEEKIDIIFSGLSFASRSTTNSTNLKPGDFMPEETPQNTYFPPQTNLDMENNLKTLTAEITHLTKSNNNLSSCINALGSSGLIDLLEILSCSLERLHAAVTSLREEQKQRQQQQAINPNHHHETQFELQMELIQRLGFLLGQREEQLKQERRLNQSYRRSIEGLEEMIRALEEEWGRAMPVMARSDYVHVEGLADCIRKLSRNGE